MSEKPNGWQPGQRAVINRQQIVTIDRATPTGRAVVGDRRFAVDGYEIGRGGFRQPLLELLTPEIEAEMALVVRGRSAGEGLSKALRDADGWLRNRFSIWGNFVPDAEAMDTAERLTAAIRQVMGPGND